MNLDPEGKAGLLSEMKRGARMLYEVCLDSSLPSEHVKGGQD